MAKPSIYCWRATRVGGRLRYRRRTTERGCNARIHVIAAVGSIKLAVLTTGRLDEFLVKLHDEAGYATAKIARTVLNGTCGMLVRRDSLPSNPVRDVDRPEQGARRAPRALNVSEIRALLRLTLATLLDEQSMTARVIADRLGRARPSMTEDV